MIYLIAIFILLSGCFALGYFFYPRDTHFIDFKKYNKYVLLDSSPKPIKIKNKIFYIYPLTYWQLTKLLVYFESIFDDLHTNIEQTFTKNAKEIIQMLSMVLAFTKNKNDKNLNKRCLKIYRFLKRCKVKDILKILELFNTQNDISHFLKLRKEHSSGNYENDLDRYRFVDSLAHEYGWSFDEIMNLTVIQINILFQLISNRKDSSIRSANQKKTPIQLVEII